MNVYWAIRDRVTRLPFLLRVIKARSGQGFFDTAKSYEIEYPYREGASIILRVYHRAIMFGILDSHPDLDDDAIDYRLIKAIQSANGGDAYCKEAWADRARRTVAAFAVDDDDLSELSQMLGLDDPRTQVCPSDAP